MKMCRFSNFKLVLYILMLFELIIASLYMFSDGFLLSRDTVNCKSSCETLNSHINPHGTVCPKKSFEKAILLIFDALRYDFVEYDSSDKKSNLFFKNKVKVLHDFVSLKPNHTFLTKFIADPPTTTMQRLKGLTTGSLPTFIDAGHNFASSEILEDNIIDQMIANGFKIKGFGDDTWDQLFPGRFHKSFFYPSFNVMDLDEVDNGILLHLYKEMELSDWNFTIAHFLGIDHCGHRYGPNHPEMERKLVQMNEIVKNVTKFVDEETLLLVIGDHGMTSSGDHGGDSREELETVLFMYSPGLNISQSFSKPPHSFSQIDLVPTLSLLMGIPIPCSNLGKVLEPVFKTNKIISYLDALTLNFGQVERYLELYREINKEFPPISWQELKNISVHLKGSSNPHSKEQKLIQFLNLAKNMCEEIWAKFNFSSILLGLISLSSILILTLCVICDTNFSKSFGANFLRFFIFFSIINCIFAAAFLFNEKNFYFVVCFLYVSFSFIKWQSPSCIKLSLVSTFCVLLASLGSFSNSFIVSEDLVISFLFVSFLSALMIRGSLNFFQTMKSNKKFVFFKSPLFMYFIVYIFLLICIRASRLFFKCREEQHWCEQSFIHVPLGSLPKDYHIIRFSFSFTMLLVFLILPRIWLRLCGNLNSWNIGIVVTKTFPVICVVLSSAYWALQSASSLSPTLHFVSHLLPRLIYAISALGIILICYNPMLVYLVIQSQNEVIRNAPLIPQLFLMLKRNYGTKSTPDSVKTPIVYGLATSLSAPFVVFISLSLFPLLIVGGDGMVPGILLLVLCAVLTLVFLTFGTWSEIQTIHDLLLPNWRSVCAWFLLSVYGFYATGHQATFPTLNWFAAFVGFDGSESYLIPTLLVIMNTYTSHIFFGISLPLLLIAPFSFGFLYSAVGSEKLRNEVGSNGEFLLVDQNSSDAKESLIKMSLLYIFCHSFKVLVTSLAAFVLRRHLMVWKIFAPHFVFEVVGLLVSCVAVVIGLAFALRVITVLEKWTKKLG